LSSPLLVVLPLLGAASQSGWSSRCWSVDWVVDVAGVDGAAGCWLVDRVVDVVGVDGAAGSWFVDVAGVDGQAAAGSLTWQASMGRRLLVR